MNQARKGKNADQQIKIDDVQFDDQRHRCQETDVGTEFYERPKIGHH